jgi:hypothetical protein
MILSLLGARKVYLGSLRVHHGLTGVAVFAVGCAASSRVLRTAGLLLALDDIWDYPWGMR